MELFKIGFLPIRIIDIVDISLVSVLLYKLYDWLRGSIGIRIAAAVLLVILLSWLVENMGLVLIGSILNKVIGAGFIVVIVLFAPELRRFLVSFARTRAIDRLWKKIPFQAESAKAMDELLSGIRQIQKDGYGALIVLAGEDKLEKVIETGDVLNAVVSERLLLSIFNPHGPMHDGAVVISSGEILAARCVLPITEKASFPPELGLRHRAASGLSEDNDVLVIIVSEQSKEISVAFGGILDRNVNRDGLERKIRKFYRFTD